MISLLKFCEQRSFILSGQFTLHPMAEPNLHQEVDNAPLNDANHDILRSVFVVNRFFYLLCLNYDSMKDIYLRLRISRNSFLDIINPILRSLGPRSRFLDIVQYARRTNFSLLSAYPIYRLSINGFLTINNFKDLYIELLLPKKGQFDLGFFPYLQLTNRKLILQNKKTVPKIGEKDDYILREQLTFKQKFETFPDCIKNLNPELKFKLNNSLSICFLYGQLTHPVNGISSPHLRGEFIASLRRANTGFLTLNSPICNLTENEKNICKEILEWLKVNNKYYENNTENLLENNQMEYINQISAEQRPQGRSVSGVMIPNNNANLIDKTGTKVGIIVKNNENSETVYVPLNQALAMMFPLLFPDGNVPNRPGASLRKQAQFILSLHPSLRCGRLGCYLLLYLYNLVSYQETKFYNSKVITQRIQMPQGVERNFNELFAKPNDPAFPQYWIRKQNEVTAMIEVYGSPDLMMTLTFNNNWKHVRGIRQEISRELHSNLSNYELYMCPLETMLIWETHFKQLTQNGFNDITNKMGVGDTVHYVWRLEFQARGAPHVHALIWLKRPISINNVSRYFSAEIPPAYCTKLRKIVSENMIHTCNIARCKHGDPNAPCKYGFPKPCQAQTFFDTTTGNVVYERSTNDLNVVEFSPVLLLNWNGHAHVHILKTLEYQHNIDNLIYYVSKYNMKAEPSLRIETDFNGDGHYQYTFSGRVLSSEEAAARLFSYDNVYHNVSVEFISTSPPETRNAAFNDGQQIQMDDVAKYFHRPLCLEKIGILEFYSKFSLVATNINSNQNEEQRPLRIREPGTLSNNSNYENDNFILDENIENILMLPCISLPNAKRLMCRKKGSHPLLLHKNSIQIMIKKSSHIIICF